MIKFGRKGPAADRESADARSKQNISVSGDALRRSTGLGAALFVSVVAAALAYLLLVRAPEQRDTLVAAVAANEARILAQTIGSAVTAFEGRLGAATETGIVRNAVATGDADKFTLAEMELRKVFPDAAGVRLIPLSSLGTADSEAGMETLRNHIEIDLVRRVSVGEEAQIEAYEHEGALLTSLVQEISLEDEAGGRAALLLTLREDTLRSLFTGLQESLGGYTLTQAVYGDSARREVDILSIGTGLRERAERVAVANTQWHVEFAPGKALIDRAASASKPAVGVYIIVALAGLAAIAYVMVGLRSTLKADVERIAEAAQSRTPVSVQTPELADLARDLRRNTLRGARASAQASPPEEGRSTTSTVALTNVDGPAEVELPGQIFRAYDIRGIADTELTDENVFRIGSALATLAGEVGEQTLFLGYDGRPSSARLRDVLQSALLRCGRDVIDIGLVPTPVLYYATHHSEEKSGIMITGSHSPREYNGLKMVLQGRPLSLGDIDRIRDAAQRGRFSRGTGRMVQQSVTSDYLDEVVGDIAIAVPLRIVIDAGNGATSHIAPDLFEELGCEVVPLNCEIDGSFPNRSPDTGDERALEGLVEAVLANKADFGVAFDGDGDRLAVVTGRGRILRTDTLMMLLARDVVSRHPGADVVYDVKCSRNLGRLITNLGGHAVLWKTGHALMKQKMMETGALLGGEFSGHIFFGERWYGFDDGMYAAGRLAEILASVGQSIDEHIADLPETYNTPELLVPIDEDQKFEVIERFVAEAEFPGGKSSDLDGLRVDFQDGWGLLRASNTGPNLTARFEGSTEEALRRIQRDFHQQLATISPDLKIPF